MRGWSAFAPSLLAAALLGGCADPDLDAPITIDGPADCPGCATAPRLDGNRLLAVRSDVVTRSRDSGRQRTTTITFRGVAALATSGSDATLRVQPCAIGLPRVSDHELEISQGLVEGLAPVTSEGVVAAADGTVSLGTDPAALVLGARLSDPLSSPLPQSEDDASVLDQDGDGEPGVTVSVSAFEAYLALRVRYSVLGTLDASGRIAGSAEIDAEVSVLEDNVPLYSVRDAMAEGLAGTDIVSETNRFAMERLPEGSPPTCAAIESLPDPL